MSAHTERTQTCFLALDILFNLLEHLPPAELLIMARSCKTLHGASIRALLRQGVTLTNTQQLRSFCAFLQADVPVRAPLIRSLNLSFRPPTPARIINIVPVPNHPLLWLFQHMNALELLRIKYANLWLQVVQGLDTVLAELTTLCSLYIAGLGNTLYKVIDSSKSQLIDIDIDCEGPEIGHMGAIPVVVKAYRTTLERIIARNCGVFPSDNMVFPRMRALALRNCEAVDLSLLYSTFPNLCYLEVSGTYVLSENESPWLQHGSHASVEHPWLGLEHLCGALDSLCRLPLSRRTLKHLDVDHVDSSLPNLERLHTLISSTSPSRLIVRTGWQDRGNVRNIFFNTENVPALLDVPEAASITHFVLDMLVHRESGTEDALLEGIITLLSSRPSLVFFALQLDSVTLWSPEKSLSDRPPWDVFEPASQAAIAHRLAASSPWLRHICLSAVGCPPRYWSIDRVAEETVLTELESMVGRELVHAEGVSHYDRWFNTRSPDPCLRCSDSLLA